MKYLKLFLAMIVSFQTTGQAHVTIRIIKNFPPPGYFITDTSFAQEFTDLTGYSPELPVSALAPTPLDGGHLIGAYAKIPDGNGGGYRKYSFIFVKGGQIRRLYQKVPPIRADNNVEPVFTIIQDRFVKMSGRYFRLTPNEFTRLIAVWDDKPVTLDYLLRDEARFLRNAVFAY
jgi:hypothetical protein